MACGDRPDVSCLVVTERDQHQASDLRMARADLPAGGHAVAVGEPDVQDGDVGRQRREPGQRRFAGPGLADGCDAGLGLEQVRDTAAADISASPDGYSEQPAETGGDGGNFSRLGCR